MSILWRYLARTWLKLFATTLLAVAGLYVVVDVFNRIGEVLPYSPSWRALVSYFLFKTPKILFDVFPAASLLATLTTMGVFMRSNEMLAMRACGMSPRRIALPIVISAFLLSLTALLWSEEVVPVAATRSRWLWDVELKQKVYRGVYDAASLWFQNDQGFVHIRRYDAGAGVISGLSLYEADRSFDLQRIYEIETMIWQNERWVSSGGFVKNVSGVDLQVQALAPAEFELREDPENLAARKRRPEEFGFRQLRIQIEQLKSRGLGADEFLVDLHHKLAWPFAGFFVALLGVPLALRAGRGSGLARGTALGLVVGFAYWIVTGLALSAGRTGGLSPAIAAWTANILCMVIAVGLYSRAAAR